MNRLVFTAGMLPAEIRPDQDAPSSERSAPVVLTQRDVAILRYVAEATGRDPLAAFLATTWGVPTDQASDLLAAILTGTTHQEASDDRGDMP